jgi:hypothetical protein
VGGGLPPSPREAKAEGLSAIPDRRVGEVCSGGGKVGNFLFL